MSRDAPTTQLCRYDETRIFVRERDLCAEVIGKMSFTDFMFLQIMGKAPGGAERAILDAVLVTLCEHGLTPSAISARLTHLGAPESLQGAVAAGLLGVGSTFVGTMEGCAFVLKEILDQPVKAGPAHGTGGEIPAGMRETARRIIERHRAQKQFLPGFGHPHHRPDDPRPAALFATARAAGVPGKYIDALLMLGEEVDRAYGRHITINATGAIAALLLEIDVPPSLMRGFAVISRAAGLVGHLHEEQLAPAGRAIWEAADGAVPYSAPGAPSL
jgi:citrate synthase